MLPKIEKRLNGLVEHLKAVYTDGLVSVVLYGSAASGEFKNNHSNVNLAVVLNDISLENLAKVKRLLSSRRYAVFNVIFFTEDYIKRTQDVFPIEFLDIQENHSVLYGKDVFSLIKIDMKNLRFQCEQELKEKIIQLSKFYLTTRDKTALRGLLLKSFSSSLHVLRNVIRIKGKKPPYRREDVIQALAAEFGLDLAATSRILGILRSNTRLPARELDRLFFGFSDELSKLAGALDRISI